MTDERPRPADRHAARPQVDEIQIREKFSLDRTCMMDEQMDEEG